MEYVTPFGTVTLPDSQRISHDRIYEGVTEEGMRIRARVRWSDECCNGYNSFAITGETKWSCGCIHEEIAKTFPNLAPLIKYHLMTPTGPLHYLNNTLYLAGDHDCYGGPAGMQRKLNGELLWRAKARVNGQPMQSLYTGDLSSLQGAVVFEPVLHEGKERELGLARQAACWPEATDEQLCLPKEELAKLLLARLPALMAEFKAAVESLGFKY